MKRKILLVLLLFFSTLSLYKEPIADTIDTIAGATNDTYNVSIDNQAGATEDLEEEDDD